uniref:DM2 domain-containing protein n=1 Tax=Tanacetum cinerariifolium TaxID=118510 RepID=A0A699J381_TANCI|nr:hypothetical protein [Tanacetum cinerariifolium]
MVVINEHDMIDTCPASMSRDVIDIGEGLIPRDVQDVNNESLEGQEEQIAYMQLVDSEDKVDGEDEVDEEDEVQEGDEEEESSRKKSKVKTDPEERADNIPSHVILSDALANCLGTEEREMSHSEALRLVWEYIKVNNLEV